MKGLSSTLAEQQYTVITRSLHPGFVHMGRHMSNYAVRPLHHPWYSAFMTLLFSFLTCCESPQMPEVF